MVKFYILRDTYYKKVNPGINGSVELGLEIKPRFWSQQFNHEAISVKQIYLDITLQIYFIVHRLNPIEVNLSGAKPGHFQDN